MDIKCGYCDSKDFYLFDREDSLYLRCLNELCEIQKINIINCKKCNGENFKVKTVGNDIRFMCMNKLCVDYKRVVYI